MGISSFTAGFLTSADKDLKESKAAARKLAETRGEKRATDILKATAAAKAGEAEYKNRIKKIQEEIKKEKYANAGVSLSNTAMAGIVEDPIKYEGFMKIVKQPGFDPKKITSIFTPLEGSHEVQDINQRATTYTRNEAFKNLDPFIEPSSRNFLGMKEDTSDITKQMAAEAGVTEEEFSKGVTTAAPEVTGTFDQDQLNLVEQTSNQLIDNFGKQLSVVEEELQKNPEDADLLERQDDLKNKIANLQNITTAKGEVKFTNANTAIKNSMQRVIDRFSVGNKKYLNKFRDKQGIVNVRPIENITAAENAEMQTAFKDAVEPYLRTVMGGGNIKFDFSQESFQNLPQAVQQSLASFDEFFGIINPPKTAPHGASKFNPRG